jgi:hypothetical protein
MNYDEVLETLDLFVEQLPRSLGNFALTSGAALVIHGVRESCNDIDIQVDQVTWETLEWRYGAAIQFVHNFPPFISLMVGPPDAQQRVKICNTVFDTECVDNIHVQTLDSIRRAKGQWGRRKDIVDLLLLEDLDETTKEKQRA